MGILAALIALITAIDTEGKGPTRENIPDTQSLLGQWDCPLVCVEARPAKEVGAGVWPSCGPLYMAKPAMPTIGWEVCQMPIPAAI